MKKTVKNYMLLAGYCILYALYILCEYIHGRYTYLSGISNNEKLVERLSDAQVWITIRDFIEVAITFYTLFLILLMFYRIVFHKVDYHYQQVLWIMISIILINIVSMLLVNVLGLYAMIGFFFLEPSLYFIVAMLLLLVYSYYQRRKQNEN